MLIAAPSMGEGRSSAIGVLLILIALVSYGFAINLSRPLQQRNGALPVIWRAVGVAALATAPTGLPAALDAQWTRNSVLSMLALGAFGTGLANVLVATAAGKGGATRASAMGFIIPAVSLFLGVVVPRRRCTPRGRVTDLGCRRGCVHKRRFPVRGARRGEVVLFGCIPQR